jgi:hypothetical protein
MILTQEIILATGLLHQFTAMWPRMIRDPIAASRAVRPVTGPNSQAVFPMFLVNHVMA